MLHYQWADFNLLIQKELTTKFYNTKCSSTDFILILTDEELLTCTYARFRKRRENEATRAPNSQSQSQVNEPIFYRYWNNATTFKKSNEIEWFLYEWRKLDFIKVRRKQSYNKHLIRRLTSQYGWVFLLVELYFGSPKGLPKYCQLVKIPLAGQPSNKIYLWTPNHEYGLSRTPHLVWVM